jgi:hypothetical protein
MSLADGGGHGPALAATEAGGSAPERTGESVTVVEAAGRGGVAPKIMIQRRAVPEQGLKRTAPE